MFCKVFVKFVEKKITLSDNELWRSETRLHMQCVRGVLKTTFFINFVV